MGSSENDKMRRLLGCPAAVDGKMCARDLRSCIGAQEGHRLAKLIHGHKLFRGLLLLHQIDLGLFVGDALLRRAR